MKTITKIMTNDEIYNHALRLMNTFNNSEIIMPAAISFSILKNKNAIIAFAEDIEKCRIEVLSRYGAKASENNMLSVPTENVDKVNQELGDLLKITQEMTLYVFSIDNLEGINLSPTQMEAILFMIDEE